MQTIITAEYLDDHPECIFVFGDNLARRGFGGAAILRWHPQTYGFITKKIPSNVDTAYYQPKEYKPVFRRELKKLKKFIETHPKQRILISKLGCGLANKYHIFEEIIHDALKELPEQYSNVELLWTDD